MNNKDMMDVVLHIGAPKTGSSAIQYFLHENRTRLLKHGYYYPEHNFDENNVSGGHAHFGAAVAANELEQAKGLFEQWLNEAQQQGAKLLISSEALYRHPERVKQLVNGHSVSVLAYFRHPLESLVSNHNQSIKRHYSTQTLDAFLYKQVGVLNRGVSGQVFFDWVKHFGRDAVSVRPYLASCFVKQQIEHDFLQRLGIAGWSARRFKRNRVRINTSYTYGALEIKRLLNGLLDEQTPQESRRIDRTLQAYADAANRRSGDVPQVVSPNVYDAITHRYQNALERAQTQLLERCTDAFYKPVSVVAAKDALTHRQLPEVIEVYQFLVKQLPELMSQLQKRLLTRLSEQYGKDASEPLPYALLKLAEVMGLPVPEPTLQPALPATTMATFLSDKSNRVDYLIEVAKLLESQDHIEHAIDILEQAKKIAVSKNMTGQRLTSIERYLGKYCVRLASKRQSSLSSSE
tara:strand:+ start:6342 stop:7727 length:1386 start_codon:yes stop_codon:yes gene_type:complete